MVSECPDWFRIAPLQLQTLLECGGFHLPCTTFHNDHNEGHANTSFRMSKLVQNSTVSASDIARVWRAPPGLYNLSQ